MLVLAKRAAAQQMAASALTDFMLFLFFDSKAYRFGAVYVSELALGTFAAGLLGSLLLYLVVQKTRLGLAMRAVSENHERILFASREVYPGFGLEGSILAARAATEHALELSGRKQVAAT